VRNHEYPMKPVRKKAPFLAQLYTTMARLPVCFNERILNLPESRLAVVLQLEIKLSKSKLANSHPRGSFPD
jgi:hypothetical protein